MSPTHDDDAPGLLELIRAQQFELLRLREQARESDAKAREDRAAVKAAEKRLQQLLEETVADRPLLDYRPPAESTLAAAAPKASWRDTPITFFEKDAVLADDLIDELRLSGVLTIPDLLRAAAKDLPGRQFSRDDAVDVNHALRAFRDGLNDDARAEFDAAADEARLTVCGEIAAAENAFRMDDETTGPGGAPEPPVTNDDPFVLKRCLDCGGDADKPNRNRKPHTLVACHISGAKARPMSVTPESVREKREHPPELQPVDPDDEDGDELQDEWTPEVRALCEDPAVNENGVYVHHEEILIPGFPKSIKCSAMVCVAQGNDGRWRASYKYRTPKGGGSGLPSVNGESFGSHYAAVRSVCDYLSSRFAAEGIARACDVVAEFIATLKPDAAEPLVEDWQSVGVHDLELSNALANALEQLGLTTAGKLAEWLELVDRDEDDGSTAPERFSWVYRATAVASVREALEGIRQNGPASIVRDLERVLEAESDADAELDEDEEPCNQWDAWDRDKLLGQVDGWDESQAFTRAAGRWTKVHTNNLRVTRRAARADVDDLEPATVWQVVPVADLGLPTATAELVQAVGMTTAGGLANWLSQVESLSDVALEAAWGIRPADRATVVNDVRNVLAELRPDDDPQPPPSKPKRQSRKRTPSDLVAEVNRD